MDPDSNEDFLIELLLSDAELMRHMRQSCERRILESKVTDRRLCESVISAAVDETLESLKLKEMLQLASEELRAKSRKAAYRMSSSSPPIKSIEALVQQMKPRQKLSVSSDVLPFSGKARTSQHPARPLSASTSFAAPSSSSNRSNSTSKSRRSTSKTTKKVPPRAFSSSIRRSSDADILARVGSADAELDARLMLSPQLKRLLSRAKLGTTQRDHRSPAERTRASVQSGTGADEAENVDDDFLNLDARDTARGGGAALVSKKIDFGRRQKFETVFPDFEAGAEFDTVDDWLKARSEHKNKDKDKNREKEKSREKNKEKESKAAPRGGGGGKSSSVEEGKVLKTAMKKTDSVSPAADSPRSQSGGPRTAVDDEEEWERLLASSSDPLAQPKASDEPVLLPSSGRGAGVYVGADLVLDLDSPGWTPPGSKRQVSDVSYASDFEPEGEGEGEGEREQGRTGRRVSFGEQLVTDTLFHRSKYIPNEVMSLFYTHDETRQFQADYSYEIHQAGLQGLTWEAWWEARSQEDVDREEAEEEERLRLIRLQNLENGEADLESLEEDIDEENPFVI